MKLLYFKHQTQQVPSKKRGLGVCIFMLTLLMFSCGNERELQLPQIEKADITKIQDVSVAYLFYDETQPDSVLLNRKNLISTTNWLINVDKRLTLKQAIPHIKYLQEKKQNSSHKNEKAKNYFTCHDLSINNLGFMEFTDVVYEFNTENESEPDLNAVPSIFFAEINSFNDIQLEILFFEHVDNIKISFDRFLELIDETRKGLVVKLKFSSNITFQEYVTIKSELIKRESHDVQFFNYELIFN
ncbi:hypothetical protein H7U19_12650 [Hyunsoonleella sp. SJ7]|uniref:Lipoprotein n=1 Tax=Hyunsoonleella aquatilis TaxID=2762758 RepID=A0A923KMN6_9FLAO|nr:hypothetical protein [Hyunsoonleella aquatilis]MBC3759260.1 hypothetical protein [Hyunsoonleella aquatilis]